MNRTVAPRATSEATLRGFSPLRSALLLLGSVLAVANITVAVHELGHLIADRLIGLDARIVLEPFGGSHIDLMGSLPAEQAGWAAAAGPLFNVAVGLLAFILAWPRRSPFTLPLLLWAPIALLQESTTALVQLATSDPGTDFVVIAELGTPATLIVGLAVVAFLAGLVGLALLMPVAGIPPETPKLTKTLVLGSGFAGYYLLAVLFFSLSADGDAVIRSLSQLVLVLLVAMATAWLSASSGLAHVTTTRPIAWRAVVTANALGIALLGLFFLI